MDRLSGNPAALRRLYAAWAPVMRTEQHPMSEPTTTKTTTAKATTAAPAAPPDAADAGQAELQAQVDKEQEQGFVGVAVDDTPNENYTLQGVTSGAPTPETERGKDDE